jgi:hypothetical protein
MWGDIFEAAAELVGVVLDATSELSSTPGRRSSVAASEFVILLVLGSGLVVVGIATLLQHKPMPVVSAVLIAIGAILIATGIWIRPRR